MTQVWEKHQGRAQLAELADNIKRRELPDKIIIELNPRQLSLVLSCMRTQSYKLSKEDKPWIPEPGKSNANHTRQTGLVEIAQSISDSIKLSNERNKSVTVGLITKNADQHPGSSGTVELPGNSTGTDSSGNSTRADSSGSNANRNTDSKRPIAQPLEQTESDSGKKGKTG
jgi:hypothetical protein